MESGTSLPQRPWLELVQFPQYAGHERLQMLHSVAERFNYKDGNWQRCQVLLEFDVLVHRDEHFEARSGKSE